MQVKLGLNLKMSALNVCETIISFAIFTGQHTKVARISENHYRLKERKFRRDKIQRKLCITQNWVM